MSILIILLAAYLWHMGGQGKVWARAVCFPALLAVSKAIMTHNFWVILYWLILWLMLAGFSYGTNAPPHRFWVWVFGKGEDGSYLPVEIATRATCGLFWGIAGVVIAYLTGHWVQFGIYLVLCTIGCTIFGLNKKVEISECGTGASVA